jgi:hypothetical protein
MKEIQHSKQTNFCETSDSNVLVIEFCNFDIVCNLSIGFWDSSAISVKVKRFYHNQLELTLRFP